MARNVVKINFSIFFGGGEEKMKTIEWSNYFPFKIAFFGHILEKSTTSLFVAWSFLLVHIWFTPSEGSKGFVN